MSNLIMPSTDRTSPARQDRPDLIRPIFFFNIISLRREAGLLYMLVFGRIKMTSF
jgi:hypothetical protein